MALGVVFFQNNYALLEKILLRAFTQNIDILFQYFLWHFEPQTAILEHDYMIAWLKTYFIFLPLVMVSKWIIEYERIYIMMYLNINFDSNNTNFFLQFLLI